MAGGLAAVVATVVAVNPFGGGPELRQGMALDGTAPAPALIAAAGTGVEEAPERFDPLMRTLHIGWVPGGLRGGSAEVSVTEQSFGAKDKDWADGGTDLGLFLVVLAKGRPITDFSDGALGLPMGAVERETEDINGRPAVCLSDPAVRGSCPALRWEYAPGAWARVSYGGSAGPTPEAAAAVARKVAESVWLTAAEPVRLPFTLTGATADLPAVRTFVSIAEPGYPDYEGQVWSASIAVAQTAAEAEKPPGERRQVSFEARKSVDPGSRMRADPEPNATVGGHDAWVADTEMIVWNVSGTRAVTWYENWDADPRTAYADLRMIKDPADPADWPVVKR
ncbi:hypothetical protein Ais01nite_60710 [Asanoa ishikariensis]|nr:hypothetical protein Ais01nite_60710 [Asanoa ishikariensis]